MHISPNSYADGVPTMVFRIGSASSSLLGASRRAPPIKTIKLYVNVTKKSEQTVRSFPVKNYLVLSGSLAGKKANVSALLLIESSKVRMYQLFCSSRAQKCECISSFAHRELKSANVSALLLLDNSKVLMYQFFC